MKTSKLLSVILIIAILTTSFLSINSFGLGSEKTDSGLEKLGKLSKSEIVQLVKDVNLNDYMNYYVSQPSVTAPYSMGEVRADMQQNALDRLNAYRRLAGLEPVSLNNEYTKYAQASAVVNAVNDVMTHYPVRPAGMSDQLYNDGYYGSSHSNIAAYMGYRPAIGPLSFSVDMWMEDSDEYNIDRLGHRRWVLNPTMKSTGFGCATATSSWVHTAMYAFDSSAKSSDYDYISWPPSGYMANDTDFFTTTHAWSISLNPSVYDTNKMSEVDVEIEDSKGNDWDFEGDADDDGFFNVELSGYGSTRNAIIFRPDGIKSYEGTYTVTVEGLKTKSGSPTTLTFEVEFFSAKNYKEPATTETTTETTTAETTTEPTTETTTAVTTTEPTTETTTAVTTTLPTTETTEEDSSEEEITEPSTEPTTTPPVTQTKTGDLNGDGKISASDARLTLRISAKLDIPTEEQFKAADVNADGKITASDARKILRVSAKLDFFENKTEQENETVKKEPANEDITEIISEKETTTVAEKQTTHADSATSGSLVETTNAVTTEKTTEIKTTSSQTIIVTTTELTTKPQVTTSSEPVFPPNDTAVIITSKNNIYHDLECELLLYDESFADDIFAITKTQAEQQGYKPCNLCF